MPSVDAVKKLGEDLLADPIVHSNNAGLLLAIIKEANDDEQVEIVPPSYGSKDHLTPENPRIMPAMT